MDPFPNSRKVFVNGVIHPDVRVPFREIELSRTKLFNGTYEVNEPMRVYDTSGPWSDPDVPCHVREGLPALRRNWVLARGDVEEYDGRDRKPEDDGLKRGELLSVPQFDRSASVKMIRAPEYLFGSSLQTYQLRSGLPFGERRAR